MKLKIKFLKLYSGKPVAIIHKKFADQSSIHPDDRICIEKNKKKITAIVDTATGLLKKDEIIVSSEVAEKLDLKEGSDVDVRLALPPDSANFIHKKLQGEKLSKREYREIMKEIADNTLTEAEIAYFISGVNNCKMKIDEIADMTQAIVDSGEKLRLKGRVADKHSIGGVPGRTTPIIISICAAAGLKIPKTSSRAITTPAGTADALETICKVDFSSKEIKKIVKKTGGCMVWGGSLNMAPADDKIVQIEKLISMDSEPQLLASILAKKLAVNAKYVLIDIPYGKYTKVNKKQAKDLEKKFLKLGKKFKIKIACSLKNVKEPLGNGIGPALEIQDAIKVLKREDKCHNLEDRSVELAGRLLKLAGNKNGKRKAREILNSGEAFKKFKEIIKNQKGKIKFKEAKHKKTIKGKKGKIKEIDIKKLNNLGRLAGCPLDKYAGIYLHKHLGDKIKNGEKLLTVYSESKQELKHALDYYRNNTIIVS